MADELCVVRSIHSEAINHDPAITFLQTGFQLSGRPSIGSWVSYGLGAMNRDLPTYIVMTPGAAPAMPSRCTAVCGRPVFCPPSIQG